MDFPTDQDISKAVERQPFGVGLLAASALIGGSVIGAVAVKSGWVQEVEIPQDQSTGEALMNFAFGNVALIMAGYSMIEIIKEMGRDEFFKTMLVYSGGVLALRVVVDGVRKLREREG